MTFESFQCLQYWCVRYRNCPPSFAVSVCYSCEKSEKINNNLALLMMVKQSLMVDLAWNECVEFHKIY
jgi:hypothetical protein